MYNRSAGKNKPTSSKKIVNMTTQSTKRSSSREALTKNTNKTNLIKRQQIPSSKTSKNMPLPPSNKPPTHRASVRTQQPLLPKINNTKPKYIRKKQNVKQFQWKTIPCSFLITICQYACSGIFQVYKFSRVCSIWRAHMCSDMGAYFWNQMKGGQNVETFYDLKIQLQRYSAEQQQKMSFEFEKYFTKLFNYGSTKENIPNKLIQKLDLELQIRLNNRPSFIHPFKLRTFNFSSYLCAKIEQIKDFKYDFYTPHNMFKDNVVIDMIFRSKKYKVTYKIEKKYCPEEIVEMAIKQKAFNYYLDKNFVFTYFEGDNHFLYIFYEISVLELVNIFRSIIKTKNSESLSKKMKKMPMHKQLCETEFEDFVQYVKFQADFQIHFSYHNSLRQIFTHCDTKVYPIDYDRKHAYFEIKVDDSFDKVATYKLDNKMGMSESVQDLYLLDFVLKDRDRFLIIFSGFIYAREATQQERQSIQNYFSFADNKIKILQSKQPKYEIKFTIIEQFKKNLMKNVQLTFYA